MGPLESWILVLMCIGISTGAVYLLVRSTGPASEDER